MARKKRLSRRNGRKRTPGAMRAGASGRARGAGTGIHAAIGDVPPRRANSTAALTGFQTAVEPLLSPPGPPSLEQRLSARSVDIRNSARALSQAFAEQAEILKGSKPNETDQLRTYNDLVAFFEKMAAGLSRLADALDRAIEAPAKPVFLALLWQIYSRRCLLPIHFRQCGHRCGDGRSMSSRMAWRTAGKVGCGGGPLILFFPPCCRACIVMRS
jgi:hypothetical protein